MADKEMYDFLSTITPDYTTATLSVTPHAVLPSTGKKSQIVHEMDDGSVTTISISNASYFDVSLQWTLLTSSDAGTIMDFWHTSTKANGMERSFYWLHPVDGHTYVARFMSELTTIYKAGWGTRQEVSQIDLRITGRKADA